jgi:hypothetical protein
MTTAMLAPERFAQLSRLMADNVSPERAYQELVRDDVDLLISAWRKFREQH